MGFSSSILSVINIYGGFHQKERCIIERKVTYINLDLRKLILRRTKGMSESKKSDAEILLRFPPSLSLQRHQVGVWAFVVNESAR